MMIIDFNQRLKHPYKEKEEEKKGVGQARRKESSSTGELVPHRCLCHSGVYPWCPGFGSWAKVSGWLGRVHLLA